MLRPRAAAAWGICLILLGCAEPAAAPPAGATAAIAVYVDRTRHWPRDDYRIERNADGSYAVINRDDEAHPVVGCDKSFIVTLDAAETQVIKEWGCQ